MRKLVALIALFLATPAVAQKITIDYAKEFDFATVKTYEYVDTKDTDAKDPLMAERIVSALKTRLNDAGLKEVTEDPDIYVTYHVTTKENRVLNTSGFGYGGYGRGWGAWGGGMVSATTYETTYTDGTLIVDGYYGADKKLVFRGTGTVTVGSTPEKRTRQIDKILDKMSYKWRKILAMKGK